MEREKLTDWEVGQDLTSIVDEIALRKRFFRESHPEIYKVLTDAQLSIGDAFNNLGSHGFYLPGHGLNIPAGTKLKEQT